MDRSLIGRKYGPYVYEAGAEKIREFALALGGSAPAMIYPHPPPAGMPASYFDTAEAVRRHGGHGLIAPPAFCAAFAMKPFVSATLDPDLKLNLLMLVHGEQEFEFVEPVRAGDVLSTTGTITGLHEKSGKDFVVVSTETLNQHGRVAVRGVWTALVRR